MPSGKFDGGAAELNLWCPAGSPAPAGALAHAFARGRNRAAADRGEARSRLNNQGWGGQGFARVRSWRHSPPKTTDSPAAGKTH
jgi:hypothetical protein